MKKKRLRKRRQPHRRKNTVKQYEEEEGLPELAQVAMRVVIDAGDAKIAAEQALKKLHAFDFTGAEELMEQAFAQLQKAHDAQTEVIQNEAAGTRYENSFIFNHAQDTMMAAMTQCSLTREIIELYKILYREIHKDKA